MIQILPALALLLLFVFLFVREVHLDRARFKEQNRLGDEHMLREMAPFLPDLPEED